MRRNTEPEYSKIRGLNCTQVSPRAAALVDASPTRAPNSRHSTSRTKEEVIQEMVDALYVTNRTA